MDTDRARVPAPGELTGALQQIQTKYGYLPPEALEHLAGQLNVPLSQLYSVATFFAFFRLTPRGACHIQVCAGTACHVMGAARLSRKLQRDLRIGSDGVSVDRAFSLEEVRCLGCCSLAPVVRLNDTIYGRVRQRDVDALVEPFRGGAADGAD